MKSIIITSRKQLISVICFYLACAASVAAQTRDITGVVYDSYGEPTIGASVKAIGAQVFAMTNLDGEFSLAIPESVKSFEVSYVGCKTATITVTKESHYVINLQSSDIALEEMVVIGYGTAKRGDVTAAIASLKGDDMVDRPNENALGSMQGQLAGVEITNNSGAPGGELEVHIRGAASINASDQPLYVVDGIPVDDISNLNPNDIENIDVLKDASSSAIYGSRGANGVILIKTKSADKNEKMSVAVNATFGIQQMERKLDVMTGEEWIAWRSSIIDQNYVNQYGYKGATANDDFYLRLAYTSGSPTSYSTTYVKDPRWSLPGYGGLRLIDWQDEVYRLAPKQVYNVSVSNASEKTDYRISLGFTDQQGIATNTSYQRLNLRASINSRIGNRVTIGMNIAPSLSWNKGGSPDAVSVLTMTPVVEPEAGIYSGAQPYPRYAWAGTRVSPVALLEKTDKTTEDTRLQMSAYLKVDIIKGLTGEITGSYTFRDTQNRNFVPSTVNNNWSKNYPEGYYTISSRGDSRSHKYLMQTVFNYNNTFGDHRVSGMLGFSMEGASSNSSYLAATRFADNLIEDFNMTDVLLSQAYTTTGYPQRMLSFFGRAQYDYAGRYLFTATLRRDGSSKFGKNNRWGTFPSFSGAWRISNEDFWPFQNWFNSCKFRISWGANGNNSIPDGAALGLLSSANYPVGASLQNGYAPTSLDIDDLTWEKVYSWDIGFDFGFLNNRLSASLDYYKKRTTDMLYKTKMPGVVGFSAMWSNIGEIRNDGFELELRSINLSSKKLKWTSNFNLSYNHNEVTDLGNNDAIFNSDNTQVLMVGQALNSFYMYEAVGVYMTQEDLLRHPTRKGSQIGDTRYRDVNDDGVIDDRDRTIVGKPNPDFTMGLTNKVYYKGFDLSVMFTAQCGGYLYSMAPGRQIDNPQMAVAQNVFSWWNNMWRSEENPGDGIVPSINSTTGSLRDSRWLYRSDYVRLKNITLGYRIPLDKRICKSARVYFAIENVWLWDKYKGGYSPENKGYNTYPQARVYTLGLNVTF